MGQDKKIENNFQGIWITEGRYRVRMNGSVGNIIKGSSKDHLIIPGLQFTVDNNGRCHLNHELDLVERERTSEGYSL